MAWSTSAKANHGEFYSGWGAKAIGMAGIGVAHPLDAMASARNPAGIAWICDEIDIGFSVLRRDRSYSYDGTPPFISPNHVKSGWPLDGGFAYGIVKRLCGNITVGSASYSLGGYVTNYHRNNRVFGRGHFGMCYQVFFSDWTLAYDINCNHSIGVSLVTNLQRLKVWGLNNFDNSVDSAAPGHVTNRNFNYSVGIGARLGWIGRLASWMSAGLSYTTRVYNTKFSKYRGLFAEKGRLDVPPILSAGVAFYPDDCTTLAFDYDYVFYDSIRALHNSFESFDEAKLGDKHGTGFGLRNQNILRFGAERLFGCEWTARAGFSYNDSPFHSNDIDFNILAPSVSRCHLTAGVTWAWNDCNALDFGYSHGFRGKKHGESQFGLGDVTLKSSFDMIAFNFSHRF